MRTNKRPARAAALVLAALMGAVFAAPALAEAQPISDELRQTIDEYWESSSDPGSLAAVQNGAPESAVSFDYYVLDHNPFVRGGVYYFPGQENVPYAELDAAAGTAPLRGRPREDPGPHFDSDPAPEPDSGSNGGLLVLVWLLVWVGSALAFCWAKRTAVVFRPKPVKPGEPPRAGAEPGFAPTAVFYAPQQMGQPAARPRRPEPVKTVPPKVGASALARAAAVFAVAAAVAPLFIVPSWVAIILGGAALGQKAGTATCRLGLAALLVGCWSVLGNLILFALV